MKSTKERIQDYIIITIGTIIASFAVFFFLTPSHLAVGSISGLAVLIAKFVPMTVGTLLIILNGIFLWERSSHIELCIRPFCCQS